MTQIHDVSCRSGLFHDLLRALFDGGEVPEQYARIEVSLHAARAVEAGLGTSGSDALASLGHVDGPIEGDNIDARGGHSFDEGAGVFDVDDRWYCWVFFFDLLQNHLLIRSGELVIIPGTQMARPRIENLNQLRPILDLINGILRETVRQILEDGMQQLRLLERHLFNLDILLGRLPLHEVRRERVRTSHEAQDGRLGRDLLAERAEGLPRERRRRARIDEMHLLDIVPRSHGRDDRPHLLVDVEFHPHPRQRREDVAEQDAPVRLIIPPRLEGHLHGHLGNFGPFPERGVLFAQVAIFLDVAAGLAHHPYGDAFGLFAAGRADEEWVDGVAGGVGVGLGYRGGGRSGEGVGGRGR
mmetsp:Transcript_12211/g.29837  ORF Transcript_12211/g.29837 Transcript_12211/m.29837 type:complete len:356 (+) Transcript_12211:152-1219(+)